MFELKKFNKRSPISIIGSYNSVDSKKLSSIKNKVEFKFSKKTKKKERIRTYLIAPNKPPKVLLIKPKETILTTLVRPLPITETKTIIIKKVKANEAIFK